jgi:XisI protein
MAVEPREQEIIQNMLEELTKYQPSSGESKLEAIFDTKRDQYQLVLSGWQDSKRIYGIVAHIAIRNGFIWLEEDLTEANLAEQLLEAGIPRERIGLGFHAPYKRGLLGFATP